MDDLATLRARLLAHRLLLAAVMEALPETHDFFRMLPDGPPVDPGDKEMLAFRDEITTVLGMANREPKDAPLN